MALNQKGNMFGGIGCLTEECIDAEKKNLVICDDSRPYEGCKDIVDLLPNDPFGMGISIRLPNDPFDMDFNIEATFAAITGWVENYGSMTCGFESDKASRHKNVDDDKLCAEWNFVLTRSMTIAQEKQENEVVDVNSVMYSEDGSYDDHYVLNEEGMYFGCEKYQDEALKDFNDSGGGAPPDALFFALNYLGVKDLLSIERVCRPLRDVVQNDPLLWRNIHIEYPLSEKITDDNLLQLTDRAQGTLCSLNLVRCLRISNNGLKHVLERNPKLTKLSVPGCIRLGVEAILRDLKVFNSMCMPGIKHLRIGELLGTTNQLLKEFKLLLEVDEDKSSSNHQPRFYRPGQLYLSLDDKRVIDIDTCPICQQVRQVYDCPAESCQVKPPSLQTCRACVYCIARCINCGRCLENTDYEETFCLDLLCLDCLAHLLNCEDGVVSSPRHTCFYQKTSYHFYVYG